MSSDSTEYGLIGSDGRITRLAYWHLSVPELRRLNRYRRRVGQVQVRETYTAVDYEAASYIFGSGWRDHLRGLPSAGVTNSRGIPIRVGGRYRTRGMDAMDIEYVEVLAIHPPGSCPYSNEPDRRVETKVHCRGGTIREDVWYLSNGKYTPTEDTPRDLVEEIQR